MAGCLSLEEDTGIENWSENLEEDTPSWEEVAVGGDEVQTNVEETVVEEHAVIPEGQELVTDTLGGHEMGKSQTATVESTGVLAVQQRKLLRHLCMPSGSHLQQESWEGNPLWPQSLLSRTCLAWKTTNIQKFGAAADGSNVIMGNMEDDWSSTLVCGSNLVCTFLEQEMETGQNGQHVGQMKEG